MDDQSLEGTLLQLERQGGRAYAKSSTDIVLSISLAAYRPNGSVLSADVFYSGGPTLPDGTPLRSGPDGRVLLDTDGKPTPRPPGFDGLANVRDELLGLDWKVDRAGLRKEWLIGGSGDRHLVRRDIEDAFATIGPNDNFELKYVAPGADGGLGQVGCITNSVGAIVGFLIGVALVESLEGDFDAVGAVVGVVAAWMIAFFAMPLASGLAVRVRRLRPHADNVAIIAGICTSAILSTIVILLIALNTA